MIGLQVPLRLRACRREWLGRCPVLARNCRSGSPL